MKKKREKYLLNRSSKLRDARARKAVLKMYKIPMERITIQLYKKMFSIGFDLQDLLELGTSSLMRSVTVFPLYRKIKKDKSVPFVAFMITRLKSDLLSAVRKQLTLSNKSTNTALLVDWQENEFLQPQVKDPAPKYIEKEDRKEFIKKSIKHKCLSNTEKIAIKVKLEIPLTEKEKKVIFTKRKLENTWQRARRKLSRMQKAIAKKPVLLK